MTWIDDIKHFIEREIWKNDPSRSKRKGFLVRQLRMIIVAVKGYTEDKLYLLASSLTYYSLLSLVPLLALVFAFSKGFGWEEPLKKEILKSTGGNTEVWDYIFQFTDQLIANTQGSWLAGIGSLLLIYSVWNLMSVIEESFNSIWSVKKGRTLIRKFTDYFAIIIIAPALVIVSSSLTIYIKSAVHDLTDTFEIISWFNPIIDLGFKLTPYFFIWLVFTMLYVIMPNTKVSWKSAIIAGVIAGTAFQIFEWMYISLQIGVSRNNAIYGSFAALPLFLFWLNISWFIVFVGAEIAYANESTDEFKADIEAKGLSDRNKKILSLAIMKEIVLAFNRQEKIPDAFVLADKFQISLKNIQNLLNKLSDLGWLIEVSDEEEDYFIPSTDSSNIRVWELLLSFDKNAKDESVIGTGKEIRKMSTYLDEIEKNLLTSKQNITILEI